MKNNFFIKINYISNFNPIFLKSFYKIKNKNKNKIYCRNLFLFLFLLKYLNNLLVFSKNSIFIKPKKSSFSNILNAPYKNKLSKKQIGFSRYFIVFKFILNIKINFFKNYCQFFIFLNNFFLFFKFFETNIIHNYKINFYFKFKFYNYFNINLLN